MQPIAKSTSQLFHQPQILQNIAQFIPLKDLLNTSTLSKEHHQLLKQYLQQHYQLTNQQQKNQFIQLKELLNRKIVTHNIKAEESNSKINPSNLIFRNIQVHQKWSVGQTIDLQHKLIKTSQVVNNQVLHPQAFPQKFRIVRMTETGIIYCCQGQTIHRYNLNHENPFAQQQNVTLKGDLQGITCGYRYTIAVVRDQPQSVSLLLFDEKQPIASFKVIQTPFLIPKLLEQNIVMGRGNSYILFNQTLYQVLIKTFSLSPHPQFLNKQMVRIMGGKNHYIAFQKTQRLSQTWSTQQVVQFAQRQGFEDYIKIFKSQKVTGKVLLNMDKKYMEEVLGIINQKMQLKLTIRLEQCNKQNPDEYVAYGWGRAAQGQLATNPSKQITKPIKIKLPTQTTIFRTSGTYTFIISKKDNTILYNVIDSKTNKLEWKELTHRKTWSISTLQDTIVLLASPLTHQNPQRQIEEPIHNKKERLRTAKNIVDKIRWSQHLNKQQFKVGYLDKYESIILQIPFSELQQSQIKEYRIEYFKQNSKVVWDKKKRIDIL